MHECAHRIACIGIGMGHFTEHEFSTRWSRDDEPCLPSWELCKIGPCTLLSIVLWYAVQTQRV